MTSVNTAHNKIPGNYAADTIDIKKLYLPGDHKDASYRYFVLVNKRRERGRGGETLV